MRVAGTVSCSLCNGEGVRYVIFTQGCAHKCEGCQNPETWSFHGGREIDVRDLAADIRRHPYIDGITLSGGDPFYQQEECIALLRLLPGLNVWAYTGFEWEDVKDTELATMCDAVVTGPFLEEQKCTGKLYGSLNQEIHKRTGG